MASAQHQAGGEGCPAQAKGIVGGVAAAEHPCDPAGLVLPLPGSGRTWERFEGLAAVAAVDLSAGRLAEGHADALAILAEAGCGSPVGREPQVGLRGVWAAKDGRDPLRARREPDGWRVDGRIPFCSGANAVQRALVVADAPDGRRLLEVHTGASGVSPEEGSWPAVGMHGSDSFSVRFDDVPAITVGGPGFYTGRVGFWRGAAGVAACWWGGASGLVNAVVDHMAAGSPGAAELAALGDAASAVAAAEAVLRRAAAVIDSTADVAETRLTALVTRQAAHHSCGEVLRAAAAAGGARPICLDAAQSRRSADLYAYLAQHHPGADGTALGQALIERVAR